MDYWQKLKDNGVSVRPELGRRLLDRLHGVRWRSAAGGVVRVAARRPRWSSARGSAPSRASTVMTDSCVSQVEYAGVLTGTDRPELARKLVDFMQGPEWQAEIPLTNFVFPVVADTPLPEEFQKWAVRADDAARRRCRDDRQPARRVDRVSGDRSWSEAVRRLRVRHRPASRPARGRDGDDWRLGSPSGWWSWRSASRWSPWRSVPSGSTGPSMARRSVESSASREPGDSSPSRSVRPSCRR